MSQHMRLQAQTAIQPGVANVYCSVVQQTRGSAGLVIADHAHSNFAGVTYRCRIHAHGITRHSVGA